MKTVRMYVLAIWVMLLGVALWIYTYDQQETVSIPFEVAVFTPDGEEVISCWKNEQDAYFVFLPTFANPSDTQIHLKVNGDISIDGKEIQERMPCSMFELNKPLQFMIRKGSATTVSEIMFVKSDDVPSMYIDTKSGSVKQLHADKEYKEEGSIRIYLPDGSLDYTGVLSSIKGRGNATWEDYDKKPYSIRLAEEAALLKMGSAEKWILLANATDPSNMRNRISLELAKAVSLGYTSDSQWVDLYLNGEYAGLYLLCEANEVHPERVTISGEKSFLVSMEQKTRLVSQSIPYVITDKKQALRIHYPEVVSDETKEEISKYWQAIENALIADDGIDPISGKSWLDFIDLDSWVKKYLLEEIVGNWDACYISQFFYCDGYDDGAKVYAGPAWDYDRTLGNTSWQFQYANALSAQRLNVKGSYDTPWFHELYQKAEFSDRMVDIYEETFIPALNQLLKDGLPAYADYIAAAHEMNQLRWGTNESLANEVEYIYDFIVNRIEFLTDIWIKGEAYYLVQADPGFNQFFAHIAVKSGECLTDLRELDSSDTSKFLGWYYTDTDEPFDSTEPICDNVELYAKWNGIPAWWKDQLVEVIPGMILAGAFVFLLTILLRRIRSERAEK